MRYPVGVGKAGKQWGGTTKIDGKDRTRPGRRLPKSGATSLRYGRDSRRLAEQPDGRRRHDAGGGEYAIHGTNQPGSVGGFVSYGCIRMLNTDISDLYQRVPVGTTVMVTH